MEFQADPNYKNASYWLVTSPTDPVETHIRKLNRKGELQGSTRLYHELKMTDLTTAHGRLMDFLLECELPPREFSLSGGLRGHDDGVE